MQVLKYCGYPALGTGPTDDPFDRFFEAFNQVLFRMANLSSDELTECRSQLADCLTLERAYVGASGTLNVAVAAAFTRNTNELRDRTEAYTNVRMKLLDFLGVQPGPFFRTGVGTHRLVV